MNNHQLQDIMSKEQLRQAQDSKRRLSRRRVLMTGIIAFRNHQSTVPCQVRDLTDAGAHLRCDTVVHVPHQFDLIIEMDGLEAACEVAWRKDKDIGVQFLQPPARTATRRKQIVNPLGPQTAPTLRRKRPA